jgi:hypothetical protein
MAAAVQITWSMKMRLSHIQDLEKYWFVFMQPGSSPMS